MTRGHTKRKTIKSRSKQKVSRKRTKRKTKRSVRRTKKGGSIALGAIPLGVLVAAYLYNRSKNDTNTGNDSQEAIDATQNFCNIYKQKIHIENSRGTGWTKEQEKELEEQANNNLEDARKFAKFLGVNVNEGKCAKIGGRKQRGGLMGIDDKYLIGVIAGALGASYANKKKSSKKSLKRVKSVWGDL